MRVLLSVIATILFFAGPVFAVYNPTDVQNNRYGIHIVDVNDLNDAAKLVNSAGGDWGYVTIVIQDDDRNKDKWQQVFDSMRRLHLIPLVRLATHIDGDAWTAPYEDEAEDWARFLNGLNWPAENRYVIIYNEPNHANEWGRNIDPEGYAEALAAHARALHHASGDFFVLPAGLDVSANSDGKSLDAAVYLSRMKSKVPDVFDLLDGWTSHSYPNPAFSAPPYTTGRGTLRSYAWELQYLRSLGVERTLPVFITETGWIHSGGLTENPRLLSPERIGDYLAVASQTVWSDPQIVTVTPFVLNYQGLPFDHFSWRKLSSTDFYPQYFAYQGIEKIAGEPRQREHYTLKTRLMPPSLIAGSVYTLSTLIRNEGQGIYAHSDGYSISLDTGSDPFVTVYDPLPDMEPGQYGTLTLHTETPNTPGTYRYSLALMHWGRAHTIESGTISLVPPPSVTITVQLGWRKDNTVENATVLIYDHALPVHKVNGVTFTKGSATITGLRNIVPGYPYRIVVLVPYYLPRQTFAAFKPTSTTVQMARLYPLDFNRDGALSPADVWALLRMKPNFIASLFLSP